MILITIGRSAANQIVYNGEADRYVSSKHAELLILQDGSILLTDKSSANGTTVGGTKISPEVEVSIKRGDKVVFGGVADLDWSKVPVTPAIDTKVWNIYTIGVDYRNRVQIIDNTNQASRFHALLQVNKKNSKCYITDYSSNGTFVDGQRMPQGQKTLIKYKSDLKLAKIPFDWSKVKRYGRTKKIVALIAAAIIVVAAGFVGYQKLHKWDLDEVQDTYGDAIVFVRHDFQVRAELLNGQVYALAINESGLPIFIDTEGSGDIDKYEPVVRSIEAISDYANDYFTVSASGTAFFIDDKGTMATSRHLTKPWEANLDVYRAAFELQHPDIKRIYGHTTFVGIAIDNVNVSINESGKTDFLECLIVNLETDNRSKDVGLIRTKTNRIISKDAQYVSLDKAVYDTAKLSSGSAVFCIGYPLGTTMFKATDDNTIIYNIRQNPQQGVVIQNTDIQSFEHNVSSYEGISGSPIFDAKGRLAGIYSLDIDQTNIHGFNQGIWTRHLKNLYDQEYK